MKPLELRIHEKHPTVDAYRFGPSYTPYAIVAVDKRFTDSELAAEWQYQDNRCGQGVEGYGVAHDGTYTESEEVEIDRLATLYRLATSPHHDETEDHQ